MNVVDTNAEDWMRTQEKRAMHAARRAPGRDVALIGGGALPTSGFMAMYAGDEAPPGWLLCDGAAVSRSAYSALFSIVGTIYGTGDGSTTFNLPDLRGRFPVGIGTGPGLTTRTAAQGGSQNAMVPTHLHTLDLQHNDNTPTSGGAVRVSDIDNSTGGGGTAVVANTNNAGSSGTGQNMPPFTGVNFIVKV